jgi:hypothetical protein
MYGRHRQSVHDIEETLTRIFTDHPNSYVNGDGLQCVPPDNLFDILNEFSIRAGGVDLLTREETEATAAFLKSNPSIEVTPQVLVQLVAEKTKKGPEVVDDDEPLRQSPPMLEDELDLDYQTANRPPSRPPSRGAGGYGSVPQTPTSALSSSSSSMALDKRLGRGTPRHDAAPPSSFSRKPVAPHRRKSISENGSRSDSESWSASPGAYGRSSSRNGTRSRAPSNPSSPTGGSTFYSGPGSRPPSRGAGTYNRYGHGSASQNDLSYGEGRGLFSDDDGNDLTQMNIHQTISSLQMPSRRSPHSSPNDSSDSHSSSSDEEDEMDSHLIHERAPTSSTVSMMEPQDRLDALQRTNNDLNRKLMEAERTLQTRLNEHDSEIEELQARIDELNAELGATKREEKELRAKEVHLPPFSIMIYG